jgi:hypothetical protein
LRKSVAQHSRLQRKRQQVRGKKTTARRAGRRFRSGTNGGRAEHIRQEEGGFTYYSLLKCGAGRGKQYRVCLLPPTNVLFSACASAARGEGLRSGCSPGFARNRLRIPSVKGEVSDHKRNF